LIKKIQFNNCHNYCLWWTTAYAPTASCWQYPHTKQTHHFCIHFVLYVWFKWTTIYLFSLKLTYIYIIHVVSSSLRLLPSQLTRREHDDTKLTFFDETHVNSPKDAAPGCFHDFVVFLLFCFFLAIKADSWGLSLPTSDPLEQYVVT
jgi:hypothetical protein